MLMNIALIALIVLTVLTAARLLNVIQAAATLRGQKAHEVSESDNQLNAFIWLLYLVGLLGMFVYLTVKYYNDQFVPQAASAHGEEVDSLLNLNFIVISIAFVITQVLLIWFSWKYRYNKARRATHYAHNNNLELIWTLVPAVVMAVLVLKGLIVWSHITDDDEGAINLELYARQFDWTARYSGADNALGKANYTMINNDNILGLLSAETIMEQMTLLRRDSTVTDSSIVNGFLPEEKLGKEKTRLRRIIHQIRTIAGFRYEYETGAETFASTYDDVIVRDTIYLPVNRPIKLTMRSQDVIHSAYMPHFRVHMYCVPGTETYFNFTPIITSEEMKEKLNDPDFEYRLYCNNICGATHFNMMLPIRVIDGEAYDTWAAGKKTFGQETTERLAAKGWITRFANNN